MKTTKVISSKVEKRNVSSFLGQKINDYKMLVKFKLNLLVVFSAIMGFLIASNGVINWVALMVLALGGFLVTGAANTLNQVLEREFDQKMKRTENRPLAAGRMTISEAVMLAGLMSMVGIILLAFFNPLTALLGMLSLICYSFIYTPLKRVGPIAVFVGAIPGALPAMIGVVALQGELTPLALALFGIQFMWQFPHFWAIAWVGHEDYTKAGFRLLPSKDGSKDASAGFQSMIYALMILPCIWTPYYLELTGIISASLLTVATLIYAFLGFELYKKCTREAALKLMFSSFIYLPLAFIVLYLDKVL